MSVQIRIGDCRELLRAMPDESVHCVVTSPPYWGLRDYGVVGQIGMERTLGEHLAVLTDVFREVKRVLRKDGTVWLNCGDSYATHPNGRSAADVKLLGNDDRTFRDKPFSTVGGIYDPTSLRTGGGDNKGNRSSKETGRIHAAGFLKPKDLCMIANRLAIALQDDGWWVRSEIIWHKPNPMPESIKDRPGSCHEKMWLLSKSERYYYDHEAVQVSANPEYAARYNYDFGGAKAVRRMASGESDIIDGPREFTGKANLRNVWTIPTAAFSEAHFATFPPALVEPCIKAGCPEGGTVLDPFGGAGTVGLVADRLQRHAILMELNPEYAAIAERRLRQDGGMFIDVQTVAA